MCVCVCIIVGHREVLDGFLWAPKVFSRKSIRLGRVTVLRVCDSKLGVSAVKFECN